MCVSRSLSTYQTSPIALFLGNTTTTTNTSVWTFATLALLSALVACDEPKALCDASSGMMDDVIPCDGGHKCPNGLECLPRPAERACVRDPPAPYCAAPHEQDDATTRLLLVRGFAANAVQLHRIDSKEAAFARFAWEPPKRASIAVCSLFGCAPTFDRGRITNFNECVLRQWWSKPVPSMLDLRDVRDVVPRPTRSPLELRFGCWIFSDVLLIAATPLERLALNDVPDSRVFVDECGSPGSEGKSCVLDDQTMLFGRCASGQCVRSCLDESDCQNSDALAVVDGGLRDAGADSTQPLCIRSDEKVGACRTPTVQGDL